MSKHIIETKLLEGLLNVVVSQVQPILNLVEQVKQSVVPHVEEPVEPKEEESK